ncbi:ferredoxin [Streptomyces sp. SID13666]|uniref:ferredoxin n=1 Tax=unclassified Streptomyces TaxID=2593676 RepID=UPI001105CBC6|nr:ferredoxin [Streptomyces sp. So13.3]NEA52613.1 ferredoxin [Streptomyces sp. SID13666]NEA70060.1 ferredoxin [Streptomyces sp. SID13588]QNA71426.1 ferredoxin [Streptomyces sp. So13.3]
MRVTVDRALCCSSGLCVLTAPDVFDQADDDGRVLLLAGPPESEESAVEEAVACCPAGAIGVTD